MNKVVMDPQRLQMMSESPQRINREQGAAGSFEEEKMESTRENPI